MNYSVLCGLAEWFVLCLWLLMHEAHMIKEWYGIIINPKNVSAFVILKATGIDRTWPF
jgi:hypothetical protein